MIFNLLVFLSLNSHINQVDVLLHVSLLFGLYGIGLQFQLIDINLYFKILRFIIVSVIMGRSIFMLRLNIEVFYNCMELFIIECDSAIENYSLDYCR